MLSLISSFMSALPELIKLIKEIQNSINESNRKAEVKEDVAKIREAFKNKDAEALKRIFNE